MGSVGFGGPPSPHAHAFAVGKCYGLVTLDAKNGLNSANWSWIKRVTKAYIPDYLA